MPTGWSPTGCCKRNTTSTASIRGSRRTRRSRDKTALTKYLMNTLQIAVPDCTHLNLNHRRRLLEMIMGRDSDLLPFPFSSLFLPSVLPYLLFLPRLSSPSPVMPSSPVPSLLSLSLPTVQLKGLGSAVSSPACQTLLVHFQAKFSAPFHFHNDTFVIFTVLFWLCTTAI